MFRFVVALFLASLFLGSMGCRMCSSPYDYCLSTHIDRPDDFRGCGPLYRAGSVLSDNGYGVRKMSDGEVLYVNNGGGFSNNAGNYGMTTPIVQPTMQRGPDSWSFPPNREPSRIGIPQDQPIEPSLVPDSTVPTIQELLLPQRRGGMPEPMRPVPLTPPSRPKVEILDFERPQIETMPFSPSDEPVLPPPPNPFPTTTDIDPPITLEELRRLDPSVREVQIISIEDAATGTFVY